MNAADSKAASTSAALLADEPGSVRAETLGQLGAQFAHDFNNVLAVALTSIEMAMRVKDPDKASGFLSNALKVISRGRHLTDRLAAASYACESISPVDVHALIARVAQADSADADASQITMQLAAARSIVNADARFLEEALRNLVANARESVARDGTVTVATRNASGAELRADADRDYLVVAVHDTGGGMSGEVRDHAFDLFFSTHSGAGRGIGLAQVRDAARRAGGVAMIDTETVRGTRVTMAIPLAE